MVSSIPKIKEVLNVDPAALEGEVIIKELCGTKLRHYVQPPAQPQTIVVCETDKASKISTWLKQIFLPQGFPESTSEDYIEYQIFDTAQAFCSTITGILATKAVMRGVGVGDEAATPLAATLIWVLRDGCGHLGRILFAYYNGGYLDAYSKTWRLYADVLNDISMIIELTLPYYMEFTTTALCCSTTLRAIVGVAGSATRSALTQHHAVRNNLADVTAKDSAQETAINLIASVVAVVVLSYYGTNFGIYLFLIVAHLACNYCAVKAVCLKTFNPPRFMLALDSFFKNNQFPGVRRVNFHEPIMINIFKIDENFPSFKIKLGSSAKDSILNTTTVRYLKRLLAAYRSKAFVPFVNLRSETVNVLLKENATPTDVLEGYYHGVMFMVASLAVNNVDFPYTEFCLMFNDNEWVKVQSHNGSRFKYELSEDGIDFLENQLSLEWRRIMDGLISAGWTVSRHHMVVDEWRLRVEDSSDDSPQGANNVER